MVNMMGREPLPDGTRLICKNGDTYRIVGEPIGTGGCGIVYEAVQEGEDSRLAVKECYPVSGMYGRDKLYYRKNGVVIADTKEGQENLRLLAQRMLKEKEYSQKIYNRSICVVKMSRRLELEEIRYGGTEYAGEKGIFFLMDDIRRKSISLPQLMEECGKEPSKEYPLRNGGLPSVHVTAKVTAEILNALSRIHSDHDAEGYLHGDIQENNIFFQNADLNHGTIGIACMLDLGCMRKLGADGLTEKLDTAEIYSTPGYIPPEILFGERKVRLGVQADIYSLGRLLLYMLTGRRYSDDGRDRVYYDRTLQKLLPSEGEKIGCKNEARKFVNRILTRALDFKPENRYVSVTEMKKDMDLLCEMTAPARYGMAPNLPVLPTFTGRERELKQLRELSGLGKNPIWIHGFGGMGKSELAIQFGLQLKKTDEKEVYRISFRKSLAETIGSIRFTGDEAEVCTSAAERCRRNMDILSGSFKNCLLIIDNIEYGGGIGKILKDKVYQELIRQPFTLLFTTRHDLGSEGLSAVEAGPMSEEEILEIMGHFYPVAGKRATLKKIIREIGFHTLTAELAARTLRADQEALTPEQLLAYLKEHRLKQAGTSRVMSNRDREYRRKTIYAHIRNLYRISSLKEPAKIALTHMLFSAPEGIDRELYLDCEEEKNKEGLTGCLVPRGWISVSHEGTLSMHPLIRELCMQELKQFLKREYFADFLLKLRERVNLDEGEDYRAFFGAAGYLARTGSWLRESRISRLAGELFLRCRSGGRAAEAFREALRYCPEQDEAEQSLLYCDLCYAYSLVGKGKQARLYGRKSMKIRERLFSQNSDEMALVFNNLGMAYRILGNDKKSLYYYQEALAIRQKLEMENRVELAISYNNVGSAYEAKGDYSQAIPYYENAVRLCRKIYQKEHPYIAIFCNNAGKCFLHLNQYDAAYRYLSEALQIGRRLLSPTHYTVIAVLLNMANLMEQWGNMKQALAFVEDAVQRSESIDPPDQVLLAHSYFNYSYFLDRTGVYPLSLEYGERALHIRLRLFHEKHPLLKDSYRNLKWLCTRMGEEKKASYYGERYETLLIKN